MAVENVLISAAVSIPTLYSCRHHESQLKVIYLAHVLQCERRKTYTNMWAKAQWNSCKTHKTFFYIIINKHYKVLLNLIINVIHVLLLDSWFSGTPSDRIVSCALRLMETMRPNIDSALPEHVRLTLSRHKRLRGGSQEPTLA